MKNTIYIEKKQHKIYFTKRIKPMISLLGLNIFTSLDLIEVTVTVLKMSYYGILIIINFFLVALAITCASITFHRLVSIRVSFHIKYRKLKII